MNSQTALNFVKKNFLIVIFLLLAIAAFVALPIISGGMQQAVREQAAKRESKDKELTSLSMTQIALQDPTPGFVPVAQESALINPRAVEVFEGYVDSRLAETDGVLTSAIEFNRKGRSPLVAALFPDPPEYQFDVLLIDMTKKIKAAYQSLLDRMSAGQAPTLADMRQALVREQRQFVEVELGKRRNEPLTEEERAVLTERLSARRLGLLQEAAQQFRIYADLETLNPPGWAQGEAKPTPTEVFEWQWNFWAIEDVLLAVTKLNDDAQSVADSPVKRLVSISVTDQLETGDRRDRRRNNNNRAQPPRPGGGGGGPILSGGGSGMGDGGSGGGGGTQQGGGKEEQQVQEPGAPIDPSLEVPRDFTASFTGRVTNPLYDTRIVRVHLVVETDRLYDLFDAIGQRNFMTVLSLELWPTDPFEEVESGMVYGPAATSHVVMQIETVWLRSWTTAFMPAELRDALGVPSDTPPAGDPANPE